MPTLTLSRCIGLAAALGAAGALAQPVYKCEVAGKASYQSEPCSAGKSSAVTLIGGPTDADAAAARQRAQQERRNADIMTAPPPQQPPPRYNGHQPQMQRGAGDCSALAARRESAYGRRNGALNAARRNTVGVAAGSPQDQAIGRMNMDINSLEMQMRSRGCALN